MRFQVLGRLQVDGDSPVDVRRASHRRLLEILLLERGKRLTSETLIDRFWRGRPPATAKAALHTHISALRKLLGPDRIVTDDDGYQIAVEPGDVDVFAFETGARTALAIAPTHDPGEVLAATETALALWKGAPFRELGDDEFARPTIVNLEELRLELAETRASALLALDRASEVLPDLEALVIEHPLRERLWEHLMLARFRLGRIGEALRAYRSAAAQLAEIGLEPGDRLRRLEARILLEGDALRAPPHNLPPELDEFVGRSREVAELTAMIDSNRLVTITGPGGSGKTRLAVAVARGQMAAQPDGVWLVELAPTRDPELVATAVARAMGLRPPDEDVMAFLARATAAADLLIVLDNCEHLLESAAMVVAHLLRAAPGLRVLTTSREPLRAPGEMVYELGGLAVPDPEMAAPEDALATEAVRLFTTRAKQARPSFLLSEDEIAAVATICRRLDGLPLAIELAAGRSRSMTPTDISARLDNHLALLTGGATTAPARQQTLEATIDWSYRLLDSDQRATLNRLSVFRGGFDLTAAEQVATGTGFDSADIAPLVADLAEKSLVASHDAPPGRRYRLLETIRQFAEARFRETTHAVTTYGRHRDWCLGLVDGVWDRALGTDPDDLTSTFAMEADNLQGALDWCRAVGDERGRSLLAQALGWHWYLAGHLSTAAARLNEALAADTQKRETALVRALLARCLTFAEDLDGAHDTARLAVADLDSVEDPYEKVWIVQAEHNIHWMALDADPRAMEPLAQRAMLYAADSTDDRTRALAFQLMADARCWNGHTAEGLRHQRAALDAVRGGQDSAAINETYGASLYNFMLDTEVRATEPIAVVREWQGLGTLDTRAWRTRATDWLPWVFMQVGDLAAAEDAIARMGNRMLQGYNRTIYFIGRASVAWMRGDVAHASAIAREIGSAGILRWAHCYYPLLAELAADRRSVDEARRVADTYLALPVHPSREAAKLGALYPVVRAAVDLAESTHDRSHVDVAEKALETMRAVIDEHPPLVEGWTSILTFEQNLAMAEAELSRLAAPSPQRWREVVAASDYSYYAIYARWRLGEALLAVGDTSSAAEELASALVDATASGMAGLVRMITRTATTSGLSLPIPD